MPSAIFADILTLDGYLTYSYSMSYTVHQAKTNISKLLKEAESGQEVIITRGKQPVARLVAIQGAGDEQTPHPATSRSRTAPKAFDPLTDEELKELDF